LIALGTLTSRFGLWAILLLLIVGLAFWQALQGERTRRIFDRWLLRIPLFGRLFSQTLAARFSRTLGTMLLNGVPLITALGIAKDTVGNLAAADAVERATVSARGGAGLAKPLAESGIFPARLIHLLRLGEQTAQLGPIALRAAEIHEDEAQVTVQRSVALLVPVITILMGAAVAFIVGSLLLAMLSLNDLAG
jgi:general secretion pathway protein F